MAALILPILASSLLPAGASALVAAGVTTAAALAGNALDQALFGGGSDRSGPRLGDLAVTASTYGAGIPVFEGRSFRTAGIVVWSGGLVETAHEEETGGKGGSGPTVTTWSYHVDLAAALGEGPIADLRRIWANGTLIFDAGAATAPFDALPGGFASTVASGAHSNPYALRFRGGTAEQEPDATIEAALGAGLVPAYRGTALVVLERLQLADFGNAIPNLEFEIVPIAAGTVGTAAARLAGRALVPVAGQGELAQALPGYAVARPGPARAALDQLGQAFAFDVAEVAGAVRLAPRGGAVRALLEQDDLGAHEAGDEPPPAVTLARMAAAELPAQVTLTHLDPATEFQQATQRARNPVDQGRMIEAHALPLVLPADDARGLVERLLWQAWTERTTARVALSDRHVFLAPADCVLLDLADTLRRFRIQRLVRGANGVTEADLVADDPAMLEQDLPGMSATARPANSLRQVGLTVAVLLDLPLLDDGDDAAALPFLVGLCGPADGWRGAALHRSTDGGATFLPVLAESRRAVLGTASTALPAGPVATWDRASTVTVVLAHATHSLSSRPEADLLTSTVNAAAIGGEVVQFAQATLIAPQTYRLSVLLRGRLGTEDRVADHLPGEAFCLLAPGPLRRIDPGLAELGATRLYKAVSIPLEPVDAAPLTFTLHGRAKRPLAPALVHGRRAGAGGDWAIAWQPRTRLGSAFWSGGGTPSGEPAERYLVEILIGSDTVRTLEVASAAATYTAAHQVADFGAAQAALDVRVTQLSASVGRGIATLAHLT
ncbi:phage tail protein [Zavarzinia sp. CC-PAN008]|uniref:phage tail protein n=1 Tax=Zavarzinia sp. CC-PAN008 TaxID=3243332 RepID=UPI003F74781F